MFFIENNLSCIVLFQLITLFGMMIHAVNTPVDRELRTFVIMGLCFCSNLFGLVGWFVFHPGRL